MATEPNISKKINYYNYGVASYTDIQTQKLLQKIYKKNKGKKSTRSSIKTIPLAEANLWSNAARDKSPHLIFQFISNNDSWYI
jgi:hypothetical protein